MILAALFIFFVARGCVATQEATQVRKYVMSSNSLLTDSSNLGQEKLQPLLQSANGRPGQLDQEAMSQAVEESELLYQRAQENDEVPPEFEEANNYVISALGIRASATGRIQRSATGNAEGFGETLATSVEDYRTSDNVAIGHYFPASGKALEDADQQQDRNYLKEPQAFMQYDALGFEARGSPTPEARGDPNALHGVEVALVEVAGQQLFAGGTVVLSGSQEPVFTVTVNNSGEAEETNVPVEVVLNTQFERQANSENIEKIDPNGASASLEIGGFRPGELNETAEVTVEAGPVQYEDLTDNNILTGWLTFGM
ncbi:MAG: hypothetical protein WA982_02280 [Rubrobacteraceae bacterium]